MRIGNTQTDSGSFVYDSSPGSARNRAPGIWSEDTGRLDPGFAAARLSSAKLRVPLLLRSAGFTDELRRLVGVLLDEVALGKARPLGDKIFHHPQYSGQVMAFGR